MWVGWPNGSIAWTEQCDWGSILHLRHTFYNSTGGLALDLSLALQPTATVYCSPWLYGHFIFRVLEILWTINLKRFSTFLGTIILMPIILMGVYSIALYLKKGEHLTFPPLRHFSLPISLSLSLSLVQRTVVVIVIVIDYTKLSYSGMRWYKYKV